MPGNVDKSKDTHTKCVTLIVFSTATIVTRTHLRHVLRTLPVLLFHLSLSVSIPYTMAGRWMDMGTEHSCKDILLQNQIKSENAFPVGLVAIYHACYCSSNLPAFVYVRLRNKIKCTSLLCFVLVRSQFFKYWLGGRTNKTVYFVGFS